MNYKLPLAILTISLCSACTTQQNNIIPSEKSSFAISETSQTTFIRKNASSPEAADDLKALQVALKKMKNMKCETPLSWYYQGATHSIPDIIGNPTKPTNPLCPSYTDINSTPLQWGWKTCTHQAGSEIHFLIWHRLYIAHFEKMVRKLSGKSDFALPYWDYVNVNHRIMPEPFRNKNMSLFTAARLPGLNNGKPIESFMDSKLDVTDLFEERVYRNFNTTIDGAPHGAMHLYIGGRFENNHMWNEIYQNSDNFGLMTQVDSAGFDPIFWMHHSNIDYLWQQWESSARGSRPTLQELKASPWPYKFFNADGTQKQYTIEQAYNAAFNPDYVYDDVLSGTVKLKTSAHKVLESRNKKHTKEEIWSEAVNKSLAKGKLSIQSTQSGNKKSNLLKGQAHIDAIVLQLTTKFKTQPTGIYSVYVVGNNRKKQTAGILSFFGAVHHATSGGDHDKHQDIRKDFSFDITDEIELDEKFTIIIEKDAGINSEVSIESMSLFIY